MTAGDWIDERTPPVPAAFRGHLGSVMEGEGLLDELVLRVGAELRQVLDHPGRDRAAAFHLLAADALATYACEAAADAEDPEESLLRVLSLVQRTAGE